MCVIAWIDTEARRPSAELVEAMFEKNPDGAGAAWREVQGDKVVVRWEKGLMKEAGLARLKEIVAVAPIPFVIHTRIATIGGIKPNMTHPFPIDQRAQNTLSGTTDGAVLFHNGTWGDWDKEGRAVAVNTGIGIPVGKWSDSRALAWVCSILGNGFMEFLPAQKGIAFGPYGEDIFVGAGGWEQVTDPTTGEKVWCSNSSFLTHGKTMFYTISPYCNVRNCLRKDIDKTTGRCPEHPLLALPAQNTTSSVPASSGVKPPVIPFPPTPKDEDDPQGPILSMELAEKAMKIGRIGTNFLNSVKRAHERMARGGKDGDRARRALIYCGKLNAFAGLLV